MMKKLLMVSSLIVALAAGAVFAARDAQARTGVYFNTYIGGPIYPGMIVYGDPGWLPYPYYAYPISMFGEVYRIGVWRRSVRTNIRNGFSRHVRRQPGYGGRISCAQARRILLARGYRKVRAHDCKGRVYGFSARRHGRSYKLRVSARTGGIMSLRRR